MNLLSSSSDLLILSPQLPVAAPPLTGRQCSPNAPQMPFCHPGHCWFMESLLSTRTVRPFSAELISSRSVPCAGLGLFFLRCRTLHLPLLNFKQFSLSITKKLFKIWIALCNQDPPPFQALLMLLPVPVTSQSWEPSFWPKEGIIRPLSHLQWAICIWHVTPLFFFNYYYCKLALCNALRLCCPSFCRNPIWKLLHARTNISCDREKNHGSHPNGHSLHVEYEQSHSWKTHTSLSHRVYPTGGKINLFSVYK